MASHLAMASLLLKSKHRSGARLAIVVINASGFLQCFSVHWHMILKIVFRREDAGFKVLHSTLLGLEGCRAFATSEGSLDNIGLGMHYGDMLLLVLVSFETLRAYWANKCMLNFTTVSLVEIDIIITYLVVFHCCYVFGDPHDCE